jgi:hypothetical protein
MHFTLKPWLLFIPVRVQSKVASYGITFWGNSSYSHTTFLLQKKLIKAMLGYGNMVSCRNMLKELGILAPASQYLSSLLLFASYNTALFIKHSFLHYCY